MPSLYCFCYSLNKGVQLSWGRADALRSGKRPAPSCPASGFRFALQVSELEELFGLLQGDVEALFLQAPSVDLEALGVQLAGGQELVEEQVGGGEGWGG